MPLQDIRLTPKNITKGLDPAGPTSSQTSSATSKILRYRRPAGQGGGVTG
jgi:hypothetical protein